MLTGWLIDLNAEVDQVLPEDREGQLSFRGQRDSTWPESELANVGSHCSEALTDRRRVLGELSSSRK